MIDAVIREPGPGERWLWVIEQVDAEGNPIVGRDIPLAMIASWRELLGIDDPLEVLDAIMYVQDHGEPEHDLVTGQNAWTEAYQLLRIREQAREDAAARAKDEGKTASEIAALSSEAAYAAVHVPVQGDECAMDLCRKQARQTLGLPDPAKNCGEETRGTPAPVPEPQAAAFRSMQPAGGKATLIDALADQGEYLLGCTQRFLHGLTGHPADPLDTTEPEPVPALATPEETLAKYQEAS